MLAPPLPRAKARRLKFIQFARSFVIVVAVVGIAYALISAVITGPPTFSDPLTGHGTYTIAPGNFTYLTGDITGEDYVEGNYTVMTPPGAQVVFSVLNQSEFIAYAHHKPYQSLWSVSGQSAGRIVFAAPYTGTFYLVFQNPYPAASGLGVDLYIVTEYQSNVVIG
ncbi:MAG: hypothetical protein L3K09_01640 [Thermoplasmata archaeon]|nr:hypothetical protein [Thermoplasmata archaeon]